eukprot:XP_002937454.3 PREDICTED: vomeronasal type-2 receptor 26-like [Xenopus tropicalis]
MGKHNKAKDFQKDDPRQQKLTESQKLLKKILIPAGQDANASGRAEAKADFDGASTVSEKNTISLLKLLPTKHDFITFAEQIKTLLREEVADIKIELAPLHSRTAEIETGGEAVDTTIKSLLNVTEVQSKAIHLLTRRIDDLHNRGRGCNLRIRGLPETVDNSTLRIEPINIWHVLTFAFAIDEINKREDLLPNITLGFEIYDSGINEITTIERTFRILSGNHKLIPNYSCRKQENILALIGHFVPSCSQAMADLLSLYKYPQLIYGAKDPILDDKNHYPHIFSTIPSEHSLIEAIVALLQYFEWKWVGIITYSDVNFERSRGNTEKHFDERGNVPGNFDIWNLVVFPNWTLKFVEVGTFNSSAPQGEKLELNVSKIQWNSHFNQEIGGNEKELCPVDTLICKHPSHGEYLFAIHKKMAMAILEPINIWHVLTFAFVIDEINKREDLLPNITLGFEIYDSGINEITTIERTFRILSGNHKLIPNYSCRKHENILALIGHFAPSCSQAMADLLSLYKYPQLIYGAKDPILDDKNHYPHIFSTIPSEHSLNEAVVALLQYFEWKWVGIITYSDVNFERSRGNTEKHFDERGNVPGNFDIWNLVVFPNWTLKFVEVGTFNSSAPQGEKLELNVSKIQWNSHFNQVPKSACGASCSPGQRKVLREGHQVCCYDCVLCPDGEITNSSDMNNCIKCNEHEWTDERRDKCIQRETEYLSFHDYLGSILMGISLLLCMMSTVIYLIFYRHRTTCIVKANNLFLSYILLFSLTLSFLSSLLFIGHPRNVTCLVRQMTFGIIFATALSTLIGKTMTVVIAFSATKPGSKLAKWVGSQITNISVLLLSLGQVTICLFWLICCPPFPDTDTKSMAGKMIVLCNEGSVVAFYIMIGYIGILAIVSFLLAYYARRLPDSFNESQLITFSMLVFCSVWVSFIPAYINTKGRSVVAVEVFAILTSNAGLLGFIFIPKCYIILLRPELNKKEHLMRKT